MILVSMAIYSELLLLLHNWQFKMVNPFSKLNTKIDTNLRYIAQVECICLALVGAGGQGAACICLAQGGVHEFVGDKHCSGTYNALSSSLYMFPPVKK
jgi:hypothetical protein